MKRYSSLLLAAVLWLTPGTLRAQEKQTPVNPPVVLPSAENDILGVDDVITIQVSNHGDLDQVATIGQDGKITLKELGQFAASGKSRAALQNEIQVAADKTLNNASVFVTMKEKHLSRINVDGGVTAPGVYALTPNMRVLDAISAAHGLALKPARYTAKLVRNNKAQSLNVPKIYSDPESDANIPLMPNDKLVFNEIDIPRRRVTVLGQIARASTYDTDNDTTILTLINQAGGLLPAAALTKVSVTRGETVIPLNLRPVLIKGTDDVPILKFRFDDGDVLSIPGVDTKYQVLGAVNHPSSFVYPEQANITVLDALNAAGGPMPRADLKKAYIHRMVDGKPTQIKIDFDSLNKKGVASANLTLQPNDIMVIPMRGKAGPTLGDVLAPIGLLNILGFRLFN